MPWELRTSKAKDAKRSCVIKLKRNNLTGDFMELNKLGGNKFSFTPTEVGIYRVMHNVATGKNAVKGCYIGYQKEDEDYIRRVKMSDEEVREMKDSQITDIEYINNFVLKKYEK